MPKTRDPDQTAIPVPRTIDNRFLAFHQAHPEVYDEILMTAKQLKAQGWPYYGIAGIVERLRLHKALKEGPTSAFRINNDYRRNYAELVMRNCPELQGFFKLRKRRRIDDRD